MSPKTDQRTDPKMTAMSKKGIAERTRLAQERRELRESCRTKVDAAVASRGAALAEDPIIALIAERIANATYLESRLFDQADRRMFDSKGDPNQTVQRLIGVIETLSRELWKLVDRAAEVAPRPESKLVVEVREVPWKPE